jgi:hypothetical protein
MSSYPNTGTNLDLGRTASGLSTQIIVKIGNNPVGALQELTVNQARPLARVGEIGTDGVIEIVPHGPTTIELSITRLVFDQLRLPEAFSRGFRFIAAQRIPFDIEIYDISSASPPASGSNAPNMAGSVAMVYKNCWFERYSTPYRSGDYLITETASVWAETGNLVSPTDASGIPVNQLGLNSNPYDTTGIESSVNTGKRLGSMDASGLWNSVFNGLGL